MCEPVRQRGVLSRSRFSPSFCRAETFPTMSQPTGAPPLSPEAVEGLCRRIGKRAGKTVTPENLESWGVLVRQGEDFLPTHAFDLLAGRSTHFAKVCCSSAILPLHVIM